MKSIRKRLSFANIMSAIAVFIALGGIAVAAGLPKNSVGKKQLKSNAVTTAKIKKNAVTTPKIKKGAINGSKVKNDSLTGTQINESTLGTVPSASSAAALSGYSRKGIVRVAPTGGASEAAALAAAPEITMFSAGPFTVYAKCIAYGTTVEGIFYIKTSQGGAILDADNDSLDGEPFLEPSTLEEDRELTDESTGENESDYYGEHDPEFAAMAADGTVVDGELQVAVKNGTIAGSQGVYGGGSVCLFAGQMASLNG